MNVLKDLTGSPNAINNAANLANSENELKKAKLDESIMSLRPGAVASNGSSGMDSGSNGLHHSNGHNGLVPLSLNGQAGSSHITQHNGNPYSHSSSSPCANSGAPSRVVHLRGTPADLNESELLTVGMIFGKIQNLLILRGKNQAFLEFAEETAAMQMVTFHAIHPCIVKNKQCYVQFSTHKELRTDQSNSSNGLRVQSAIRASMPIMQPGSALGTPIGGTFSAGGPNTILRVVVENPLYPVSLDVLSGIFSRYGKVEKIITFTKNNQFQALIQFSDRQSASIAKQNLDGQNVYTGCCTLRIEYSRLDSLRVVYNNDKTRDYTNPHLPSGENNGGMLLPDPLQQFQAAMAGISPAAAQAMAGLAPSLMHSMASNSSLHNYNTSLLQGIASGMNMNRMVGGGGLTVLVSNMNEDLMTPENIFVLFGVYGDVIRVKILYNKKDTAMVQYAEPRQAAQAIMHLDRVKVFGKQLKVTMSKHPEVQMPKDGQPDSGLTRDFSSSPLHRFKKPGSKNYQNIYPPSTTLHLSNIPPSITEADLKRFFAENQFEVKALRFFPNDHKMALMEINTVEEATEALIKMHNYQLNENTHLRVSFSKAVIKEH